MCLKHKLFSYSQVYKYSILTISALFIQGCTLFVSNDTMTSIVMDKDERIASFKSSMDYYIGEPLYQKTTDLCQTTYTCKQIDKNILKMTHRDNPSSECVISWYVDISQKGVVKYPTNGLSFNTYGVRTKWEYVSRPELCYITINWGGAW